MSRPVLLDLFCGAGGAASDAAPSNALDDALNGLLIEPKGPTQRAQRLAIGVALAQSDHLAFNQFGCRIARANHHLPTNSATLPHVGKIVQLAPEPEMCGVTARWVVAEMANNHAIGNRPIGQLPRDAMRLEVLAHSSHLAIASRSAGANPRPAFGIRSTSDMRPELITEGLRLRHVSSIPEAHPHA